MNIIIKDTLLIGECEMRIVGAKASPKWPLLGWYNLGFCHAPNRANLFKTFCSGLP